MSDVGEMTMNITIDITMAITMGICIEIKSDTNKVTVHYYICSLCCLLVSSRDLITVFSLVEIVTWVESGDLIGRDFLSTPTIVQKSGKHMIHSLHFAMQP